MLTTSSHFSWKSGVSLGQFAWRIYPETFSTECSNRSWGFQQGLGTICCHGWSTLSYQRAKHKVNFYTHACNTTQHSQPILPIICISCYVCITTSSKQQHVPAYTVPPSSFLPSNVDFFFVQRTTNPPPKKKAAATSHPKQRATTSKPLSIYKMCVLCVYVANHKVYESWMNYPTNALILISLQLYICDKHERRGRCCHLVQQKVHQQLTWPTIRWKRH